MDYQLLVFDLDGTLVDSFSAIHASLVKAMEAVGAEPWDLSTTKMNVGWGIEALVERAVGRGRMVHALNAFREQYGRIFLSRTYLLPSVSETLPQLQDRGHCMAVATNKQSDFSTRILEHLEILRYFRYVLGPSDSCRCKPQPDMLDELVDRLNIARSKALYVGDMPLDVETATNAKVDCLLVASGPYPFESLRARCKVPVVARFADILAYLKHIAVHSKGI